MRQGTKVLITGGASGLGLELARRYGRRGAEVLVLDVDREGGAALMREGNDLRGFGGSLHFCFCDLAKLDARRPSEELVHALREGEPFDIVLCNAGISNSDDFLKTTRKMDDTLFAVNVIGHMQLIKLLLGPGRIRDGGRLGLIASASLYLPFPIAVGYAASKAAVSGLAHALEPYLRGRGISVTCVYPGPIKTPHATKYYARFDEGKGASPEKVAKAVERAIRRRSRRCRPDGVGRLFYFASIFAPGLLARITHAKYAAHLYGGATPDAKN